MNCIINMLKPPNMTSHDMVGLLRRKLQIKKVGHTGTLDPMACGVLPICIGHATKISQYLLNETKSYRCEMKLGSNTDTQDKWGNVLEEFDVDVTEDEIKKAFNSFKGEITQVPPMYSALKKDGRKLYELAREGQIVERKARKITIYELDIIKISGNSVLFQVKCSKGTYVRTLCEDIGNTLNCGGHMTFLLRTHTGDFNLSNTVSVEEIQELTREEIFKKAYSLDFPIRDFPKVIINESSEKYLINGNDLFERNIKHIDVDEIGTVVRLYVRDEFIAIGKIAQKESGRMFIDIDRVFC